MIMNLQKARKKIINHFVSSRCWAAWSWVKSEWLLARKNGRIDFLVECKRRRVVPRFISDRIRTGELFGKDYDRGADGERRFGLQILSMVVRKEFQERIRLRTEVTRNRRAMTTYTKEEYLFTKDIKELTVREEMTTSRQRLARKLDRLSGTVSARTLPEGKERVTCIDTSITEVERMLLGKGPKFVPSRRKLTEDELRAVESEIERTTNVLPRQHQLTTPIATNVLRRQHQLTTPIATATQVEERDATYDEVRSVLTDQKIRRQANRPRNIKQSEKMDLENENKLNSLKSKILDAYRKYQPSRQNISTAERLAMEGLKERDVVIKCSDKSKSLVVMSDASYQQKVADILTNSESYELVNMTAGMLEKKVTAELNMKSLKRLPADVYAGLFPKETRLPDFYGLPKIHKSNAPLRPVVAAYDSPLTAISILLERILHQLLPFVPAHIPNTVAATLSLKNTFQSLKVPPGAIIVTMDVVAMYPSIPIEDGISAVISKLRQHEEDIDTLGLPLEDIESLLRFVLTNNFFKFGDKVYRQKTGVAMGNHLAPPLAIVFMDRL